jgi:phage major head subunit gpT-like protein
MALVTRDLVRGFTATVRALFTEEYKAQSGVWNRLATVVESSSESETYYWLSEVPLMREFVDERVIKGLSEYGFSIKNRKFEATIGVEREVLEDERFGQVRVRIQSLAESASLHYDHLLFDLIKTAESSLAYDGVPFYSDSHIVGSATVANLTDLPLTSDNLETVLAGMSTVPLPNGEPMMVTPTHLLVHPAKRFTATRILNSVFYPEATGTGKPGAQAANVLQGELELITSARLASADEWHVFDCSHAMKPFLIQQRIAPEFEALDGAEGESETAFLRDLYLYGVRSRDSAGYGLWQYAYKSAGTG